MSGSESGRWVLERVGRLTGIVRAQIQRVRMISGAERWSRVMGWAVENIVVDGGRIIVEIGIIVRRVREECRHVSGVKNRGVRVSGRRIFSIY